MKDGTIKTMWQSGAVNRWHTNPDPRLRNSGDTTAAHQWRVATLVMLLSPDADAATLRAALWHDAPECFTGDVPYEAKKEWWVSTARAEEAWWDDIGLEEPDVPGIVKLADTLDHLLFCKSVAPDLLARPDWRAHAEHVIGWADTLGVHDAVLELIYG